MVPSECYECARSIASERAIFLHCECCIALCIPCGIQQISFSHETYDSSISCPQCGSYPAEGPHNTFPQIRSESKEEALQVEDESLVSAFDWIGVKNYKNKTQKDKVKCNDSRVGSHFLTPAPSYTCIFCDV
jgi:hypothetical protein